MIQWYIGLIGVFFALVSISYLFRALRNFTGELKECLAIAPIGAFLGMIPPSLVCLYGLRGDELNLFFWAISITMYLLLSAVLLFSMRKLELLIKKLQQLK